MPDALYQRYLKALEIYRDHRAACTTCTNSRRCREGDRLWGAFTRSQDAYLERQRSLHGKPNSR
ncbi:hypothetical protein [Streptomyces sp. E5N91]|uniref:hypothetical protein n=1 Tax=Streptomyces sp. E5N91 TaxID=1851996 RepID=UPI000EF583A3|nr:hypothetical protein [Streptomyces sp. E5N91]